MIQKLIFKKNNNKILKIFIFIFHMIINSFLLLYFFNSI